MGILALALTGTASAAEWEPLTADLAKKEKAGFGGICGVLVDRTTGHIYLNVSDKGLYRSTDGGQSWNAYALPFKGRTEWPGCMMFDPIGDKRLIVMATVYGGPIRKWSLKGEDWAEMDKKSSHVDWFALDWTDPAMNFVIALKHESGGVLLVSHDGGKTFTETAKGFGPAWVFDSTTAVVAEMKTKEKPTPALMRTTDGGKTWQPCGEYTATALPKWRDGKLYWLVDGALLTTSDKGEKWQKLSEIKDGKYGPIFGKDAKQMFVLTPAGVIESTDGGAMWSRPVPLPKELKGWSALTWLDYDPMSDTLYVMKMGSELYRMKRK
jgi:photosystem II stability/assembly factor-like uncharacterized protein